MIYLKIGILFQDLKKQKIPWQKNPEIYNRTAYRVVEMANALVELGHEIVIFSSLEDFWNKICFETVDLVFPLIECCFERNANAFVSTLLQMKNIPFIGNDSYINTITSDKYLFKNIVNSLGIRTPKSILIYSHNYPMIIKSIHKIELPCVLKYQYGSMSYHTVKVSQLENLKKQIEFMLSQNNGPVLCEEYIEGHEISVPVVGISPREEILAVIEYTDSDKNPLEMYDSYWKGENDSHVELNALSNLIPYVEEITNSVHRIYRYLKYQDYARFDFRLDSQGKAFLLEGNPLPALAHESAFDPVSYGKKTSFKMVLAQIVESAAKRYNLIS